EQARDEGGGFDFAVAWIGQRNIKVLVNREVIQQMILLKYEADLLFPQRGTFFRFQMMHCGFAEEIFTAPGVIVHAQNMQQRRFACARRTHDRDKISLRNLENDLAQNVKKLAATN